MAEVNLQPKPGWECLDRDHKEQVLVCLEQNSACHLALEKANEPPADWGGRIVALALGLAIGLTVVEVHH
jgi:hypothetical protein